MRPSNGGLAQVAASLWLLRKAQPLRVLAKTIDYTSTSTSPPAAGQRAIAAKSRTGRNI